MAVKGKSLQSSATTCEMENIDAPRKTKRERTTKDYVKAVLREVTADSPFLQADAPAKNVQNLALFNRSEIIIGKQLGEGAFSVVHEIEGFQLDPALSSTVKARTQRVREKFQQEAVDPETGRYRYVIKHLNKELFEKPDEFSLAASDMAVEGAFLVRMRHKNILSLRGFPASGMSALNEGHDGFFLILDRLTHTLDEQIEIWREQERQDERAKIEYGRQLASALKYLHSHRIVFRDLKPHNIGFDEQGRLQLFDFGLCRELPPEEEPCETNELSTDFKCNDVYRMSGVGTRRYMAPEVVLDTGYNCKADVYGWAIIIWEMWTLAKPFSAYNKRDHRLFVCQHNERPPLTDEEDEESPHEEAYFRIPQPMADIMCLAWERKLHERIDAAEVCSEMDDWMQSRRQVRASLTASLVSTDGSRLQQQEYEVAKVEVAAVEEEQQPKPEKPNRTRTPMKIINRMRRAITPNRPRNVEAHRD